MEALVIKTWQEDPTAVIRIVVSELRAFITISPVNPSVLAALPDDAIVTLVQEDVATRIQV